MRFDLSFDLRNPPWSGKPFERFYADFLDLAAWADGQGFDRIGLSEHHFVEDGYLPSPFVAAGAVAARTKKMRISISLVLLPLKHPVQTAEDGALVDIISGGRLELMVGAGYRNEEYEGYGISIKTRPGRMEEGVEIIKKCWADETFGHEGRYWTLKNVNVMPKPVQKPRPPIIMGGASPASARRAARIADGYSPVSARLMEFYREELRAQGKDPGPIPPADVPRPPRNFLHVAKDPEAAWKIVGPHAMHTANSYAEFAGSLRHGPFQAVENPDNLRGKGTDEVMTPEQVVELGKGMEAADPAGAVLSFRPLMGGMPVEEGRRCLELVVSEVMPHFR